MKRISIQGVISGPIPSVLSEFVDDGIVTPVNFFTKALREAEEAGEDVEVWINSPGGDVDAGNEMLAAFQSFKGYKCVTVGGMAASMAAYFALQCGARVECHENTRFMFHSARTITEAGPGALRDAADAIDRINAPIKAALIARGMDEKRVEEGFRDDRALWLDAKEALALGIVAKIVKGAAVPAKAPTESAVARLSAYVPAVAAFYAAPVNATTQTQTNAMNEPETPAADPVKDEEAAAAPASASPVSDGAPAAPAADNIEAGETPAGEGEPPAPVETPETPAPPAPTASMPDAAATLAAALSKAEALAAATLKRAEIAEKALAAAEKTIAEYEKASAELGARTSALVDALDKEKRNHAAIVGKVLAPSADPLTPQNISARLKGLSPEQACNALLEAYGRK